MLNIDIQKILNTLSYEFNLLLQNKDYGIENIVVANERYFLENNLKEKEIGIVFNLQSGLTDLQQAVLPFSLTVVGKDEDLDLTQKLLYDFVLTYTNTALNGFYQRYSTPSIDNEFVEYGTDIRSSWEISGTIKFIASNSANITLKWLNEDGDEEIIPILDLNYTLANEPSPQPMSDSFGENITINRINTFTINFTTYSTIGSFYQKVLETQLSLNKKNTRFDMIIDFGLGNEYIYNVGMVVVNITGKQALGENALVSITMAR